MKVYITKYALTQGILEAEGEPCPGFPDTIRVIYGYYHRGEWHQSMEEAKAEASAMKQRKLASLRKQITKLETMVF